MGSLLADSVNFDGQRCPEGDLKLVGERSAEFRDIASCVSRGQLHRSGEYPQAENKYRLSVAYRHTGQNPKGSGTAPISAAKQAWEKVMNSEVGRGRETPVEPSPVKWRSYQHLLNSVELRRRNSAPAFFEAGSSRRDVDLPTGCLCPTTSISSRPTCSNASTRRSGDAPMS